MFLPSYIAVYSISFLKYPNFHIFIEIQQISNTEQGLILMFENCEVLAKIQPD